MPAPRAPTSSRVQAEPQHVGRPPVEVILDLFSGYIVGWQVTRRESATVAQDLIDACCAQQEIARGQLVIHAARGSPMAAKSTVTARRTLRERTTGTTREPTTPSFLLFPSTTIVAHPDFVSLVTVTPVAPDVCSTRPTCTTAAPSSKRGRVSSTPRERIPNARSRTPSAETSRRGAGRSTGGAIR
jgi:transposase InsO family protein